ncbi:MAG: TetR/AcrR family transcriptional regulator [Myxococcota bacterium]
MSSNPPAVAARNAILDAAENAFADRGFHDTKLWDIARSIGVTKSLIHDHFGSKEDLFDAVVTRVSEAYVTAQAAQWDRDGKDVRLLIEGISVLFTFIGRHPKASRLMLRAQLDGRMPRVPYAEVINVRIRQKLTEAKQAGLLRPEVSIEVAQLLIGSVTRGFWERVEYNPKLKDRASDLVEGLLEAMLAGLLTDEAMAEVRVLLAER